LVILVLSAVYFAVDLANTNNARRIILDSLNVSANTFHREIDSRSKHLIQTTGMLSGDYAFKQVFFSQDVKTIASALENHRRRINADVIMVTDLRGKILSSTIKQNTVEATMDLSLDPIILAAKENKKLTASMVMMLNQVPYQMVVVPLLAPRPKGFFLLGFQIDNEFAQQLKQDTQTDVSLIFQQGSAWKLQATSLTQEVSSALLDALAAQWWRSSQTKQLFLNDQSFVIQVLQVQTSSDSPMLVVLQRSLDEALAPYQRIRSLLLGILLVAFIVALILSQLIANTVTKPLSLLAKFTEKVNQGSYGATLTLNRRDEIGHLINSFNTMSIGLKERDKVRDLLGKIVSPEIASELLGKNIELGGEEKYVTVLFSDLRGFTSLSESLPPKELLSLLNRYLSVMSQCVEREGGVIDKYIGDAIMAIYGAPLANENHADAAVRTGIAMRNALVELNCTLEKEGIAPLSIGIGINTGTVVAGNMGSEQRLNYSVIGDAVNLASRLESLTKIYGIDLIVSENTKEQSSSFSYQEIDTVKVKGKNRATRIFIPYEVDATSEQLKQTMSYLNEGLTYYNVRDWHKAERTFKDLSKLTVYPGISSIYLERIELLKQNPPDKNWDGSFELQQK
jgi:adenylate cyclase